MKRFNKIFLLIIILIGIFVFVVGCNKFNFEFFKASEDGSESTEITDDNQDDTEKDSESVSAKDLTVGIDSAEVGTDKEEATPTPTDVQPTANVDLPIYTVDAENSDIVPVTAVIPEGSEITPSLIVENVVESLADQSIIIGIKDVTTKDDAIIVNFDKNDTPAKNLGSGYEGAILDAIAQSLIDNLDEYNRVIYHINDEAYVSGVYEYGMNEEHFTR